MHLEIKGRHFRTSWLGIADIYWLYHRVSFDRQLSSYAYCQFQFSLFSFLVFQVRELVIKAKDELGLSCGCWLITNGLLGIRSGQQTRSQKGIQAWDQIYQSDNSQVMNSWEYGHGSMICQVFHEWQQEWAKAVKRHAR